MFFSLNFLSRTNFRMYRLVYSKSLKQPKVIFFLHQNLENKSFAAKFLLSQLCIKSFLLFIKYLLKDSLDCLNLHTSDKPLSKFLNFPAKKLRKNTGAYNTHAPIFLKNCNLIQNYYSIKMYCFIRILIFVVKGVFLF